MLDDLITEIATTIVQKTQVAFITNQYPGDDNLVEDKSYWEAINLSEQFKGKDWRDISLELVKRYRFSMSLFTPQAFRYYLPTFILASVLHTDDVDTLPENVFLSLTPPEKKGSEMDKFLERAGSFNATQKEAIREYVKLYVLTETSYSDPKRERAVKFWNQHDHPHN